MLRARMDWGKSVKMVACVVDEVVSGCHQSRARVLMLTSSQC